MTNAELLRKLVSFKTTENNPEEIREGFEYIAGLFDKNRFDTKLFEKNGKQSLLVSFQGKDALKPKILLNGHFDVVPEDAEDQWTLKVEGDRAYGRGAADMKAMCAVMIQVMLELGKQNSTSDVALLLNGDEEIGGEDGAGYMVREIGMRPGFVFCGDGEAKGIVNREKGGVWLELIAQGKTGHAAYPWEGENALDKVLAGIQRVKEWIGKPGRDTWETTMNVASIETSNKTPNKIPADAKALLDIRFTEAHGATSEEIRQKVQDLVLDIEVRSLTNVSLLVVQEDHPLLQKFRRVAEEVSGADVPFIHSNGATDARYFAEVGIPCVIYGCEGEGMHGKDEWVSLKSMEMNMRILRQFLASI